MKKITTLLLILFLNQLCFGQENLDSLLFEAVKDNNMKQVKQLVEKGADVNFADENKANLLMWATYMADIEMVKYLVSKGADYKKKGVIKFSYSGYYGNLLGIGAGENKSNILKYFIEELKINIEDNEYNSESKKDDGWNALHWAVWKGHIEIVEYLLSKGANIDAKCQYTGNTPLIFAVKSNKTKIAKILIKKGAKIHTEATYKHLLNYACGNENGLEFAKFLIEKSVEFNSLDKNHLGIALGKAAENKNGLEIVKLLIKKGANINFKDDYFGTTPLHFASRNENGLKIVKLLIEKDAEVNVKNRFGETPLHIASINENGLEIAKSLIEKDADVNARNMYGNTSLHYAFRNRNGFGLLKLLIEKGADNSVTDNKGETILHKASFLNNYEIVNLILKNSLNSINIKNRIGETALIKSVSAENYNIVKLLLRYGAEPNLRDHTGQTAMYIATIKGDKNLISLLKKHKAKLALPSPRLLTQIGHTGFVYCIAFSPDGERFISGSRDETIKLWNATSGKEIKSFKGHKRKITSVSFSPGGKNFISGSDDNTIKLWNVVTGKEIKSFEGHTHSVTSVSFSPDGKNIISGSSDKKIKLWDISTGKEIKSFMGHTGPVRSVSFSPDGKSIVSGSDDSTIMLWDVASGKKIKSFKGGRVFSVSFSPDGKSIVSVSNDHTMKLWDVITGKKIKSFDNIYLIHSASFSPDGKSIVCGANNKVVLWDVNNGKEIKSLMGHTGLVSCVSFSPDGKSFVSGFRDGTIKLWDIATGKKITSFKWDAGWVNSISPSPDGKSIVASSMHGTTKLWDIDKGKEIYSLNMEGMLPIVSFSPDGKYIISGSINTVKLWDMETGKEIKSFLGHTSNIESVSFSPDGKSFISSSYDKTIKLWDIETGKEIKSFSGHTRSVKSVSFSPDGKSFISGSGDNTIKLWDIASGKELATIVAIDSTDWAITTPSGLFDASPDAMKLMYYVVGLEVIELEQLKKRYYLPGLLKKIIKGEKLRDVQGFNDVKLPPKIELSPVQDGKLNIKLRNNFEGGIGRVVISINGKEIEQDARGGNIKEDTEEINLTKNIENHPYLLADTTNVIEVKAFNAEGWLVSRGSRILYKSKKKKTKVPELFIVSIGVSDYEGDNIDLKYAAKDAKDIANALQIGGNGLFGTKKVHTYLLSAPPKGEKIKGNNTWPTKANIIKTFKEIKEKATSSDVIVVYLSGHGINHGGEEKGDFYYLTADAYTTAYNDPAILKSTTLSSKELTELIKLVPALKQVLIIDACASGKVVENLMAQKDIPSNVIRVLDRMKDRTGMHIITGSAADAVSYEAGKYGQGVLTYSLIDGIRGSALREEKYVDINTLFQYSKEKVPVLAKGIGGIQEPQVFSPHGAQSFDIGLLSEKDKESIELANVKPVFIRSMFMDTEEGEDVLGLTDKVDNLLNEAAQKGTKSKLIFVDVRKYPEAHKLSGFYSQENESIQLSLTIKHQDKKSKVKLIAKNLDELLNKIQAEITKLTNAPMTND